MPIRTYMARLLSLLKRDLPLESLVNTPAFDLSIGGMSCAACSARIERVVSAMEGVTSITVSLATHTAHVALTETAQKETLLPAIVQKIAGLGFSAEVLSSDTSSTSFLADTASRWQDRMHEQNKELQERRRELVPAFCFALPLLLLSMGEMAGMPLPSLIDPAMAPGRFAILQLLLCLPVLWSGRRFFIQGIPALFRKSPTMDTLVALGTGAAFLYSLWNTLLLTLPATMHPVLTQHPILPEISPLFSTGLLGMLLGAGHTTHGVELYYESAAVVIALVSLGKYLEVRSKMRTSEAMKGLLDLTPETAIRLPGLPATLATNRELSPGDFGEGESLPLAVIGTGDFLLVKPGSRIPVDGAVVAGTSHVDEAMLTGESMPVNKSAGDNLAAGTMNQHGTLVMRADKVGKDTVLARIVRLVQDAQGSKADIASIADRVSMYFVPAVMLIALAAGIFWWLYLGSASFGIRIFVSVMVIACPCAMGLATPMSIMVGTGRGAQLGLLFKNGQALENISHVTAMVLDKTGTLTEGKPKVTDLVVLESPASLAGNPDLPNTWRPLPANVPLALSQDEQDALCLAASLETLSEHPLAQAVVQKASESHVATCSIDNFTAIPGKGVSGTLNYDSGSFTVSLGNLALALQMAQESSARPQGKAKQKPFPPQLEQMVSRYAGQGKTPIILSINGLPCALVAIADPLRAESKNVIALLQKKGIKSIMLTGDNPTTARAIADEAGIGAVIAGVLPEGKAQAVISLQEQGEIVAMVGDGINDAPALAQANVGIAMGSGIDVAIETGDVVLMRQGLASLGEAVSLGRAVMRNIRQNLFWAFAFNTIGIPFAAGVFLFAGGPALSPMLAGSAMAMSSVCVVTNALRLRFFGDK